MLLLLAALQFPPMQNFPEINRPGTYADLRGSVERACGITAPADVKTMLDREFKAAWDVHGSNVAVDKWRILGCARADLAGERSPSSPGPLMDGGNSWAQGAERAMQEVLKLQPGDARAAEVLGLLALDDNDPDNLKTAAASVIAAVERGVSTPGTLRACSELASQVHAEGAMRVCSEKALRAGYDSTWHLTRLAQLAFRGTDSVQGAKLFLLAASVARDSLARQEVNWHLQWFLTPDERKVWAAIADSVRGPWLRDKLVLRDVRDGQPLGARLAEHFSRLEYVETNFRMQVPRRTREALRTGPSMDDSSTYANDTLVAKSCEAGKVRATPFRFYPRWQTDFDDRGVVWMRFGAPEKRIQSNPSCRLPAPQPFTHPGETPPPPHHELELKPGEAREIWLYEIDGQRMLLNFEYEAFSGSIEATRLVTGVLGSYMCDVDVTRCGLTELSFAYWCYINCGGGASNNKAMPAPSEFVAPEDILRLHHEDAEYISVATTKDDNSPRGEKNVAVVSRLHRLWDPVTGAPIALVTYALPIKDLAIQKNGDERTTAVHLELRQWDPAADQWRDTAFTRRFVVPDTNLKRPNLVGFVTTASAPGVTAWSFVATQSDQRRGRAYDVTTSALSTGPLVLSDLVLGAESQGVVWNFHNVEIPLAPTTVLDRKLPVALYYQIKSDVARADLRTTAALYRVADGVARDSAALQVTYDQAVHEGINEVAPVLDLSRLDKGSYALEVRLTDAEGKVVARRRGALDLN